MTLAQQYRLDGRQEGLTTGRQEDILEALNLRFGSVPDGIDEAIRAVENDVKLRELHRAAICCQSLDEFLGKL